MVRDATANLHGTGKVHLPPRVEGALHRFSGSAANKTIRESKHQTKHQRHAGSAINTDIKGCNFEVEKYENSSFAASKASQLQAFLFAGQKLSRPHFLVSPAHEYTLHHSLFDTLVPREAALAK